MQKISFQKILKINLIFWSGWLHFYSFIIQRQIEGIDHFAIAFMSSFFVTFPLFFLSLALWPLCRNIPWGSFPPVLFFTLHFFFANLFSTLWLILQFGSYYLVLDNLLYHIMNVDSLAGWQYPQGVLKYMVICGFYYSIIFNREIAEREIQESQLRLSLRETEWKALKAQLNPHFLFNALNSISALITSSPGKAREMIVHLSELLRRILSENPTQTVTLEEELAFVHRYLDLEKIRLQNRLSYEENVDPALLSYPVPVMMLQPLMENAIKHGISNVNKGGWVRLNIQKEAGNIVGVVENSFEAATANRRKGENQSSTGLKNLQQRLALLYGENVQFSAQPSPADKAFRVQFHFPVNGGAK